VDDAKSVSLPFAACRLYGMAGQFSRAAAGDQLAIQRCSVTCNYCPEKNPCRQLTESERQRFIAGIM
jgi:hypothetical protein